MFSYSQDDSSINAPTQAHCVRVASVEDRTVESVYTRSNVFVLAMFSCLILDNYLNIIGMIASLVDTTQVPPLFRSEDKP